mgnify:CR=1 FL=1|jgi:hypothetical protein|tara:strand:- start:149 stop:466 length:318 start_codon:yes stop_codon:yes gene_type:complete
MEQFNILHFKNKDPDEGAMHKAKAELINNAIKEEARTQKHREDIARKEARSNKGKTHPTLGKCVATIPAREYFRLIHKYGTDTVLSKEFLQYFNKKHKDLSPNKA